MNWTSERIKHLRRRLGWSQSDLARRLHCESSLIASWEAGFASPLENLLSELDFIERQADSQAEVLAQEPLAERLLHEDELGQIDLESVKRRFSENN